MSKNSFLYLDFLHSNLSLSPHTLAISSSPLPTLNQFLGSEKKKKRHQSKQTTKNPTKYLLSEDMAWDSSLGLNWSEWPLGRVLTHTV